MPRVLGVTDLALFNIAAIASLRGFSGAAQAGAAAIPLLAICSAAYFLPTALMVTGLARRYPVEGGFYIWIREAFGERLAFLSAWIYSIGILMFFPVLLIFGASIGPHVLGSHYAALADRPAFVLSVALLTMWGITIANIFGLERAKWISNAGGAATYIAFAMLLACGILTAAHRSSATAFGAWPKWTSADFGAWAQMTYLVGAGTGGPDGR